MLEEEDEFYELFTEVALEDEVVYVLFVDVVLVFVYGGGEVTIEG